jgi:hypothetical protein
MIAFFPAGTGLATIFVPKFNLRSNSLEKKVPL